MEEREDTNRKPMLLLRLSGVFLLRLAARRLFSVLLNDPPRNTRRVEPAPVVFSLPSAISWKITKVKFNAKQNGTNSGTTLVEIRSASGGLPTTTVLDSQSMLENTLTTPGYSQKTFSFANVPATAVGTGLCIVLKFSVSSPSCFVQYLATGASSGSNTLVSTTNSDPGWTAGAGKSMLFEAWGTYRTQDAQAYQYFLQDMRCALRTGTSDLGRVEKRVRILNEPQVVGP